MSLLDIKVFKKGSFKKPITIIIGRRITKKAVQRNLLKRRIKAIFNSVFLKNNHYDYLIKIKPGAIKASFVDLKNEIKEKLKILSK